MIADSGPGLGPDAAAHAFERGWSTKPTDRPMGRGVGLALVAQAVHRLGGAVRGRERGGRRVHRAPARRRGAPPAPERPGVAEPGDPARIAVDIPA